MPSRKYCKTGYKHGASGNAGFSLIEIMVGMVMGLISMVIVMQVFSSFEGQKRTTTGGSDAQTNGGVSLYTIERDVRMAGYGFADALGCTVKTAQPTPIQQAAGSWSFVLAPVTITQGTGGLPDGISVMGSNKQNWSVPVRNVLLHSSSVTSFDLSSTVGIAANDLLIAYETNAAGAVINPGALNKTCALVQVSNVNGPSQMIDYIGGNWNGNAAIFPAADYTDQAMLINMGSLMVHNYSIDDNSNLITAEYDSAINAYDPAQVLSPDVVNLQAQYGFDTRAAAIIAACPVSAASGQCSIVDTWSDTMIDADGSGVTGDAGDIGRIYAVRFAVVARSGLKEKPDSTTGVCNTTTSAGPDNRPRWAFDATNPSGIVIDVSNNPDGTANADWRCYRYKTFETVVPLRNAIWKQR
jgi:type IV pilus assembly protein PilW